MRPEAWGLAQWDWRPGKKRNRTEDVCAEKGRHSQWAASGQGETPGSPSCQSLAWDVQPTEPGENKVLLLQPHTVWGYRNLSRLIQTGGRSESIKIFNKFLPNVTFGLLWPPMGCFPHSVDSWCCFHPCSLPLSLSSLILHFSTYFILFH